MKPSNVTRLPRDDLFENKKFVGEYGGVWVRYCQISDLYGKISLCVKSTGIMYSASAWSMYGYGPLCTLILPLLLLLM
jgi:hypothetical protein